MQKNSKEGYWSYLTRSDKYVNSVFINKRYLVNMIRLFWYIFK